MYTTKLLSVPLSNPKLNKKKEPNTDTNLSMCFACHSSLDLLLYKHNAQASSVSDSLENHSMETTKPKLLLRLLISLQCLSVSISILHPEDFLALQSIRNSLEDSPGSHFFHSWDFTTDPCSFPGVSCVGDHVAALNLGQPAAGSPGLTGRIHPAIGKLSALTEFTIVPGRVMGNLPDTLSDLTGLRFFAVSRNYLSGEIPAGIAQSAGLRTLDLSYNQLTGSIPGPVSSLPVLTNLILNHNHLTGPVLCFKSGSLARIDLTHNNLSGVLAPDSFPPSIEYLSLALNRIAGPVDRVLPRMTNLNYLDLSVNRFTGIIPSEIFRFPLTGLKLQRNMFFGRVQPEDQVTITTVDLSYNRLYGEISPMLSTVKNLYLNSNKFMGQVPACFVDRLLDSTIQVLYLHHNYLTAVDQLNPTVQIPFTSSVCLLYNCMVPPIETSSCPFNAGTPKIRPSSKICNMQHTMLSFPVSSVVAAASAVRHRRWMVLCIESELIGFSVRRC